MRTFFDASAFAKRFVDEKGSAEVDRMCQNAASLGLSVICIPEIISALNRKVRNKEISRYTYSLAKDRLFEDVKDADIIQLIPKVIVHATLLLETNNLRAMEALHIACAIEWDAQMFVSSDRAQIGAARKAKMNCKYV